MLKSTGEQLGMHWCHQSWAAPRDGGEQGGIETTGVVSLGSH